MFYGVYGVNLVCELGDIMTRLPMGQTSDSEQCSN